MPNSNEMLLKVEGFQYYKSLYSNMEYYHTQLRYNASNLCMMIILWGKYRYKRLRMGVYNSPYISNIK